MAKKFVDTTRNIWAKTKAYVFHNLLHADDPPHRLALGVALAMFVTFTPTVGFQMALVFFLAWLFRANKVVGLPLVWISNPATLVPIYYGCYWVGRKLLGLPGKGSEWFDALKHPPAGFVERIQFFWQRFEEILAPLMLGSAIVGGILGLISYYVTYWLVSKYRLRKWGQLVPPSVSQSEDPLEDGEQTIIAASESKELSANKPKDDSAIENSPKEDPTKKHDVALANREATGFSDAAGRMDCVLQKSGAGR